VRFRIHSDPVLDGNEQPLLHCARWSIGRSTCKRS
jgi:hypothetical protein